jgi:hypothetical protein
MEGEFSKNIEAKLDIIIKLLCSKCVEGKSKTDSILVLETIGVDRELISQLTGSTPASIRSTIFTAKKKEGKNPSNRKSREAQLNEQPQ